MANSFSAPLPGLCKVCAGKIDAGESIQDIKVPGHGMTRWAHDACANRVDRGLLVWNGQYFAPSTPKAGAATATPAAAPAAAGGGLFAEDEAEESTAVEKRRKFMADKTKVIERQGYVCRVGAAPVPGEDIWIYGGEVTGAGFELASYLEAPTSQFSGQGDADAAAVRELSDKLMKARDKVADRGERSKLADVLTELNSAGQGTSGEAAASGQSQGDAKERAQGVETQPAESATDQTGTEQPGEAKKKGGRRSKKDAAADGKAGDAPAPQPSPGEGEQAAPSNPSPGTAPGPSDASAGQQPQPRFDGQSEEPGYDPLLLAFDQRVAHIVKLIVGPMLQNIPAASMPGQSIAPAVPIATVGKMPAVRHERFDIVLQLARARQNILLVGPTQSGKTTMAEQIAEALGLKFYSFGCSVGMTESAIKGRYVPTGENGRFQWEPSAFVTAFEHGGVCLVDEIDAAASDVAIVMNAPLSNNWMSVESRPDKPRAEKHPDFICIASANTFGHGADRMYVGRQQLDFATLQRFDMGQVELGYSEAIEAVLCPDAGMRAMLLSIRNAIDVINRAAPYSIRRAVATSFLKKAHEMRTAFQWTDAQLLQQLFCGWSKGEIERVQGVVDAGGKLPE